MAMKNIGTQDTPNDVNDATTPGGYYFSANPQNAPTQNGGFLLVFGQSNERFAQAYVSLNGEIKFRVHTNFGYGEWF